MEDDSDDDFDFEELREKWRASRKNEFNFDEWAKEIDEHPAFMTKVPEDGQLSEAAAALQAMKYDDSDDAEVQAKSYKDDGNKNFELKKYRWAIDCYTEGIKRRCADAKLNAVLYANRAACHFRLENYRSALKDCLLTRKFDPNHSKALMRGIECLLKLQQPDEALLWIKDAEKLENEDSTKKPPDLNQLKTEATKMMKMMARDERKAKRTVEKDRNEKLAIMNALKARRIRFREPVSLDDPEKFSWSKIEVSLPGEERVTRVHLVGDASNGILVWPVLFLYPEFGQTDFIREFAETETFREHVQEILSSPAPWDVEQVYNVDTVEVYFESSVHPETLLKVPLDTPLSSVLSHPQYWISSGLPCFFLHSSKSSASRDYLAKYSISSM